MTLRRALITATGVMMLTAGPLAQTKTTENTGKALTGQTTMTGEVVLVDGNNLLVRMQPGGQYRVSTFRPNDSSSSTASRRPSAN